MAARLPVVPRGPAAAVAAAAFKLYILFNRRSVRVLGVRPGGEARHLFRRVHTDGHSRTQHTATDI